jgi:single-strand DNA-binding protein
MNKMTLVGNLTADPELRFTTSGKAVAHFTVASTPRRFDREAGTWVDGDTVFLRCNAWGTTAENITESLAKGARVLATGQLTQRTYTDKDGANRTVNELDVEEIGATLRFAAPTRTQEPALESASA